MKTAIAVTRTSACAALLSLFAPSAWAATPAANGKAFNPDIGVNFLGLWQRGTALSDDRTQFNHNGAELQEAEFQFSADIDPYLRGVALFSVAPSGDGYGIDPEEVFAETIALPQLTIRAGKFKLALGKHNQLHTHAFPFIDAPLINQTLLGAEDGLNEPALSVAWLAPTSWYSEVILQAFDPSNDVIFGGQAGDIGGLLRLKNLFDLDEEMTMELGASEAVAKNKKEETATVTGGDLTFKWRPQVGGKYHAWIWQTEYLYGFRAPVPSDVSPDDGGGLGGLATWFQYQCAERWWVQLRAEHVGWPHFVESQIVDKQSVLLGFFPSEFSGFRLQYDLTSPYPSLAHDHEHTIALQFNVSIGAHPAHAY